MSEMSWEEFRKLAIKAHGKRHHESKNSWKINDAYRWQREKGWKNVPKDITEKEYFKIVKTVNAHLADDLLKGFEVVLPFRMGSLVPEKFNWTWRNGSVQKRGHGPIDWNATIKLWHEDDEAHENRTLVRFDTYRMKFSIHYDKTHAHYHNRHYFEWLTNRTLKGRLKDKINEDEMEAYLAMDYVKKDERA